jgi:hypothetical protein
VTADDDKTLVPSLLLEAKRMGAALKGVHGRLLKRKSDLLKESDPVGIDVDIQFNKIDYTDVEGISVFGRN